MAYSYIRYTGNGTQTDFTFAFPYFSTANISVTVNGVAAPFTWVNSSTVKITTAPALGAVIFIQRTTPKDITPVNFVDGSVLLEADLDTLALFSLYAAQESIDEAQRSIQLNLLGEWEADGDRITNMADPVNAQDAVTKNYFESVYTPQLDTKVASATASANTATTKASEASASATSAATSAATSTTQAGISTAQAVVSTTQAGIATTKASEASSSASSASTSATSASSSAASALTIYGNTTTMYNAVNAATTSATTATTKASEAASSQASASASQTAAATSATNAATSEESALTAQTASETARDVAIGSSDTSYASAIQAGLSLNTIQAIISLTLASKAYSLLGSSIMKTGSIFTTAEYGIPENITLSNSTTSAAIYVKNPTTGVRIPIPSVTVSWVGVSAPTFTAISGNAAVTGSTQVDNVYVVSGSDVDLTALGSKSDVIYLTGAWLEYAKTYTGETITFSRILGDGVLERVKVGAMNSLSGNEKLVFSDGSVLSYNARSAVVANPSCAITSVAGYDATTTTPATPPSNFLYIDTLTPSGVLKCDGTAIGRGAYPALFARIGTSFGVGDGATTFNLPNIPPVAVGIPYYIKA